MSNYWRSECWGQSLRAIDHMMEEQRVMWSTTVPFHWPSEWRLLNTISIHNCFVVVVSILKTSRLWAWLTYITFLDVANRARQWRRQQQHRWQAQQVVQRLTAESGGENALWLFVCLDPHGPPISCRRYLWCWHTKEGCRVDLCACVCERAPSFLPCLVLFFFWFWCKGLYWAPDGGSSYFTAGWPVDRCARLCLFVCVCVF